MNEETNAVPVCKPGWLVRLRRWLLPPRAYSRDEVLLILREAERSHLLEPDTLAMMEGAFQVAAMRVRDIMIPRAQMVMVEEGAEPTEFLPMVIESGHSRFPLLDAKRDQVEGILLAKDLLAYAASGESGFDIRDLLRPAVFVPESKRLTILLREFRANRNHMAIVVDEYGSVAGLVTIEDVLEQIVGEIDDEHDLADEQLIRPHGRQRYSVKAWTPLEEFNEFFNSDLDNSEVDTVGGFLIKQLGHLPVQGETVEYGSFRFRVLKADQRRVHLIAVIRGRPEPSEAEGEQAA